MHVPIIFLEKVEKPLIREELDNIKIYEADLYDQPAYSKAEFDYIGAEYSSFDSVYFESIYNGNILELVEEDKETNFFHVFRVKENAIKYISEEKIKLINDFMAQTDSSNFRHRYYNLEHIIIDKLDTHIVENNVLYPLDEWILSKAEENAIYQIVQVLDAHL